MKSIAIQLQKTGVTTNLSFKSSPWQNIKEDMFVCLEGSSVLLTGSSCLFCQGHFVDWVLFSLGWEYPNIGLENDRLTKQFLTVFRKKYKMILKLFVHELLAFWRWKLNQPFLGHINNYCKVGIFCENQLLINNYLKVFRGEIFADITINLCFVQFDLLWLFT